MAGLQMSPWEWAHFVLERVTKAGEPWLLPLSPPFGIQLWWLASKGMQEEWCPTPSYPERVPAAQDSPLTSYCTSSSKARSLGAGNES